MEVTKLQNGSDVRKIIGKCILLGAISLLCLSAPVVSFAAGAQDSNIDNAGESTVVAYETQSGIMDENRETKIYQSTLMLTAKQIFAGQPEWAWSDESE